MKILLLLFLLLIPANLRAEELIKIQLRNAVFVVPKHFIVKQEKREIVFYEKKRTGDRKLITYFGEYIIQPYKQEKK